MKCYIRKIDEKTKEFKNIYFNKHLFENQNHWTTRDEAKIFPSVLEARKTIKKYKLKNVAVEKIKL